MKLSQLTKQPFTATTKHDFNWTGFYLAAKLDESFEVKRRSATEFKRTNTTSNVRLKDNVLLKEEDVVRLIEAGRVVSIFYKLENRLDIYNLKDEMAMLNLVVKY